MPDSPSLDPSKLRTDVDAGIAQLRALGQAANPLELLAQVASFHLTQSESEGRRPEQSEAQVEYLLSLLLGAPFPSAASAPQPAQIQQCIDCLEETYKQATIYYSLTSKSRSGDQSESEVMALQRLQTLHVRGDAYRVHTERTYREIAASHDEFLQAHYHFNSADLLAATADIARQVQASLDTTRERMWAAMGPFDEKLKAFKAGNPTAEQMQEFTKEHADAIADYRQALSEYGRAAMFVVLPRDAKDRAVFQQLALEFGQNSRFIDGVKRWVAWPLNETNIGTRPLIVHDAQFYAFHLPLLTRSPLLLLETLLFNANPNYWQHTYLPRRDSYVEATAIDLIAGILSGAETHKNLYYEYVEQGEQRRAEVDGLILYGDHLLIVEVKASSLSEAAKRGAPDRIREDLTVSLDKAYAQATRVLTVLRSQSEATFTDDRGAPVRQLRLADFPQHVLISVTRELFSSLAARPNLIRRLGLIAGSEWPWAVNLNDLRVIADMITHPTVFLHYLVRRLAVNDFEAMAASDELDLFGHFLAQGLYFIGDKNLEQCDFVLLSGYSETFDEYYRSMGAEMPTVKPRYPLPAKVEALITALEQRRPAHFSTACLEILAYGTDSLETLAKLIGESEDALRRKKVRLYTMVNKYGEGSALMIVAVQPGSETARATLDQARRRKREQGVALACVILWKPPVDTGQIEVHLL